MHRTPLAGTQRRTRCAHSRPLRARTLEDRLSRDGASWRRTHGSSDGSTRLCNWRCGSWRRSLVHRTRPSLGDDHARRWRLWRTCHDRWCGRTRRHRWHLRRSRCADRRCCWRRRRNDNCRGGRHWTRRRRDGWCGDRHRSGGLFRDRQRSYHRMYRRRRRNRRRGRRNRRRCRGRRWPRHRRHSHGSRDHGRHCGPRRRRHRFLLLGNGLQHVSGPGDVRQIYLRLDFLFAAQRTCGPGRRRLRLGCATDVDPNFFRFMLLERAGMGLLLRHPDER